MLLIVGLGNPGKEYEKTRHTIGFECIDYLDHMWDSGDDVEIEGYTIDFTELYHEENKKFVGIEYEINIVKKADNVSLHAHVGLFKPLTYMNKSGEVLAEIVKNLPSERFKVEDDLLVIHDDLYFPFGEVKLGVGRGSASHNGVQNIIDHLHTQQFARLRVGIGNPGSDSTTDYVLSKFSQSEQKKLPDIYSITASKVASWLIEGARKSIKDNH